jgi:hypothetical protein
MLRGLSCAAGGKSIIAHVTDRCVACQGAGLDMSPALFASFAPQSQGVIQKVTWSYI